MVVVGGGEGRVMEGRIGMRRAYVERSLGGL